MTKFVEQQFASSNVSKASGSTALFTEPSPIPVRLADRFSKHRLLTRKFEILKQAKNQITNQRLHLQDEWTEGRTAQLFFKGKLRSGVQSCYIVAGTLIDRTRTWFWGLGTKCGRDQASNLANFARAPPHPPLN